MNTNHSNDTKVKHKEHESDPVQGNVVDLKDFRDINEDEESQQHQGRQEEPSMDDFIAASFIKTDQNHGHDDDDSHQNESIVKGVQDFGCVINSLVSEWSVNQVNISPCVEGNGCERNDNQQHTERDWDEEFDDMTGSIL